MMQRSVQPMKFCVLGGRSLRVRVGVSRNSIHDEFVTELAYPVTVFWLDNRSLYS